MMFGQASSSSSSALQSETKEELPWIEKYRPRVLNEVAHQEEVVSILRRTLKTGNLPHLLFYGPPGTGKTSTILAMARELYGPIMSDRVLELNASSERGIKVVRERVKAFASLAVGSRNNPPGYPCPPYKLIILDEADSMTKDAQSALRRTMEVYTRVTRFVIICNYISRIIDPISSRCAKFRFQSLPENAMVSRLNQIATAEALQVDAPTLRSLVALAEGDMRKAVSLLQSAQRLAGRDPVNSTTLLEVATILPQEVIDAALTACKANSFAHIQQAAQGIVNQAYPVNQFIDQFGPVIVADESLTCLQKAHISIKLASVDHKLIVGGDEFLQLLDVLGYTSQVIRGNVPTY